MDLPLSLSILLAGLFLLYYGGKWLVEGAVALAMRVGISRLFIGLTIVALGTSAPEAILSFISSLEGSNALSLSNVIGANIANVGLVLGVAALIAPIIVRFRMVVIQVVFLVVALFMLLFLGLDGRYDFKDGLLLLLVLNLFFLTLYLGSRHGGPLAFEEEEELIETNRWTVRSRKVLMMFTIVGIVLLAVGAQMVIEGAASIARSAGVSQEAIGLTLVAFGTTVPELTVSITASKKGETDIIIGNVLGTIIINSLFVIGIGALVAGFDTAGPDILINLVIMSAFILGLLGLLVIRERITRKAGSLLLVTYLSYLVVILIA